MSEKVTFLLEFGPINKKLKVDRNTSPLELEKLAAAKFDNITSPVTLQYYDKDFNKWVVVDEDYDLTDKDTLKLVVHEETSQPVPPKENNGQDTTNGSDNGASNGAPSKQTDAAVAGYKARIEALYLAHPKCQGIAFIEEMSSAIGTNEDGSKMEKAFKKLNFAVFRMTNIPANDMKALTQAIAEVNFPIVYKYIAFYFAGHGGVNSNGDSFIQAVQQGNESDRVYISKDIINVIQRGQKAKRLLFFFDCCMSVAGNDGRNDPPPDINVTGSNTLVARASSFGEKSFGTKNGGLWTNSLSEHIGDDNLLVAILDKVNSEVKKKYGQHCNVYNTGFDSPINLKDSVKPEEESLLKKSPKQDHVVTLLHDHIYEYDRIGQLLGVDFATRQHIKLDFVIPTALEKMNAIVDKWSDGQTSDVTWEHFIKAMKDGSLNKLAGEIQTFIERDNIKQEYAKEEEWVRTK